MINIPYWIIIDHLQWEFVPAFAIKNKNNYIINCHYVMICIYRNLLYYKIPCSNRYRYAILPYNWAQLANKSCITSRLRTPTTETSSLVSMRVDIRYGNALSICWNLWPLPILILNKRLLWILDVAMDYLVLRLGSWVLVPVVFRILISKFYRQLRRIILLLMTYP